MKTLEAYVMTREDPFLKVKAQIYPEMPFTMIYQIAPRRWGAGDIEIGMSYNSSNYSGAVTAMEDIRRSGILERAASIRNGKNFDERKQAVMDKAIEENNVKLYDYLNSLKEIKHGKELLQ